MNLGLIMSLCNTFSANIAWSVKPSRLVLREEICVNSEKHRYVTNSDPVDFAFKTVCYYLDMIMFLQIHMNP